MRLDKFIASATVYSRTDAKKLIKTGNVSVNGHVYRKTDSAINPTQDQIQLFDQTLSSPQARYLMLHKPEGVICANEDSEHPTVLDLINEPKKYSLQIVGRLDKDTTGLVLLTDDGQWNHKVTSPNKGCTKTYRVKLKHPLKGDEVEQFKNGLLLKSETKKTRPATLIINDEFHATLSISEGRYHQVKRMFGAVGNRVETLHRQSIGAINLDPELTPGDYRPLTDDEIKAF